MQGSIDEPSAFGHYSEQRPSELMPVRRGTLTKRDNKDSKDQGKLPGDMTLNELMSEKPADQSYRLGQS